MNLFFSSWFYLMTLKRGRDFTRRMTEWMEGNVSSQKRKVFCFSLTALCTNRVTSATTLLEGDNTLIANSLPIISCAFKWAEILILFSFSPNFHTNSMLQRPTTLIVTQ